MRYISFGIAASALLPLAGCAEKEDETVVVEESGWFHESRTRLIATTVESLRQENKLQVFSYKTIIKVEADTTAYGLEGTQTLFVPAVVNYFIDLSKIGRSDVKLDESSQTIRIKLPPLSIGDVAFQPEEQTTVNGGVLTFNEGQVEKLLKMNYKRARRGAEAQAKENEDFIEAAQLKAQKNVQGIMTLALGEVGSKVKVAPYF